MTFLNWGWGLEGQRTDQWLLGSRAEDEIEYSKMAAE